MIELTIVVPPAPVLERALGYPGEARWIAAWWERGAVAMVGDGLIRMRGIWDGYLTFVKAYRELRKCRLGSSFAEAREWLVIDRVARRAYIATPRAAEKLLQDQWRDPGSRLRDQRSRRDPWSQRQEQGPEGGGPGAISEEAWQEMRRECEEMLRLEREAGEIAQPAQQAAAQVAAQVAGAQQEAAAQERGSAVAVLRWWLNRN